MNELYKLITIGILWIIIVFEIITWIKQVKINSNAI